MIKDGGKIMQNNYLHKDLVTVVTVTYNAEELLEETILSVINQNYENVEYIIIDGASTDGTVDIIKNYENKIDYWVSEPDEGIYFAMNKAIEKATGQWINFMNAGDAFFDKETISYVMKHKAGDGELIYGDFFIKEMGKIKKAWDKSEWDLHMPFCHQTLFTRTSIMKEELFDTRFKLAADHNFIVKMNKDQKKFDYIDKTIAVFSLGGFAESNEFLMNIESLKVLLDYKVPQGIIEQSDWYKVLRGNIQKSDKNLIVNLKKQIEEKTKKTQELVSIIIPCYNQAQYLEEAVHSAIYQTYLNIEIIIINDGSTDNTQDISEKLEAQYPEKIKVISQKNSGVSEARNNAIRRSNGHYILPLDADDKLDVKMISECMDTMIQTDADIVHGGLQCFGERDDVWISRPFTENNILYENLPHGSSLYRKRVWEKIEGYKQNMKEGYEDWEFWINADKHNFTFHYLPKILFYYRIKKISRDTLAIKKDIYLKAKIMMNHPELYMMNQVQEAIKTLKDTEGLADLYFYYDEKIPHDEKTWLTKIAHKIKNNTVEDKQVLKMFDTKIALCNIDILTTHMSMQELYDEMDVSFILFFSPTIRYKVKILQNSNFAWDENKGIVNAEGTLFPFVVKSERENPKYQEIANMRLEKYHLKISSDKKMKEKRKITNTLIVSVCVMSYNLEKYIAKALDSILMQKVNFKYNIVVGEDCSTD
ncbi:MAG: glycosyltransferase, partial [Bacteroidales bacterium]|nr:glycosyltransferase [Bacteroidales bacterium]